MIAPARRTVGVILFVLWFWWLHGWAANLATVSPIHWPLLFPELVLEGVPATIGIAAGALLFLKSSKATPFVILFCVSAMQSFALARATPDINRRYSETVMLSKKSWRSGQPPLVAPTD